MHVPEPQPAKAELALRRITVGAVARHLGVSRGWAGRCLNSQVEAPASFRRGVAELLGRPEAELFRPRQRVEQYPGDGELGRSA
jgi:hypothetical protein